MVWLNEAQHYLGDPRFGERIAAALHDLLTDADRGPVLVLGTLWPRYCDDYTALPSPSGLDPHSRTRELLAGRILTVPDTFDHDALAAAHALALGGDGLLVDALTRAAAHGRLAQDLAGAPELLLRYAHGSPAARALLNAAMDARRLDVQLHLPQPFLTEAAIGYLTDHDWEQLPDDWAEAAFAELARPVHGKQAALRRTATRPLRSTPGTPPSVAMSAPVGVSMVRLADYLEQHGRATRSRVCPPASFWHAAQAHLTGPDDLYNLANAAEDRHRRRWADHLRHRAADAGHPNALSSLARRRDMAGDWREAEALYWRAAEAGHPDGLLDLAWMCQRLGELGSAEILYQQAADTGNPIGLLGLAEVREEKGDFDGAEALYQQMADTGDVVALANLMRMKEQAGERVEAEALARKAADDGDPEILINLALLRGENGAPDDAEALYRYAAGTGHFAGVLGLAEIREDEGDFDGAEALYRQAAGTGHPSSLGGLARLREEAGDREEAEVLAWKAAGSGYPDALDLLVRMREHAGDRDGAEALVRQAADAGQLSTDPGKERWPYGLDPDGSPTLPWC
ncbi:tetratricopeptide repeat protein [Kitasatospora sp. NPDC092039]|uniref:tetratricopeptide repeat protein n=1 Tax=Kitasatospora sp. NPDC092039 TaxID=3364086 RepID=UPI0038144276